MMGDLLETICSASRATTDEGIVGSGKYRMKQYYPKLLIESVNCLLTFLCKLYRMLLLCGLGEYLLRLLFAWRE
jgi:hypothetical protein